MRGNDLWLEGIGAFAATAQEWASRPIQDAGPEQALRQTQPGVLS